MFGDGALGFREFMTGERLPLATIQGAVLEFLRGRDDAVVFGAQAVNAYVDEPRMTQDIDLVSPRAVALAQELRDYLRERFHIAVRVRKVGEGRGYRVFQVHKPRNRHLIDVRRVNALPPAQRMAGVLVVSPAELIATKVMALQQRRGRPKSGTDWRDVAVLLLKFPELKTESGPVLDRLHAADANPATLTLWKQLVAQDLLPENDEF